MARIIVIGTNHAGTHAVTTLLENYKEGNDIVTYDKNDNISFLGCGMALWIGHVIDSSDGLFYATPEDLRQAGCEVNMKHEVTGVDYANKTISIVNLVTGEEKIDYYDKLIIAAGSWPILPAFPGHDLENVQFAKILQNAQEVIKKLENPLIKKVAVVGAGYIGVELVEAFKQNGKEVTLIYNQDVLNRYYDPEFQIMMRNRLIENGVDCRIGELLTEIKGTDGKVSSIVTTGGEYEADMVLISIGFKPSTEVFKSSELEMFDNGAIVTNEFQETSIKDVYAIGDCATVFSNATQSETHIALATNALRTGIVSAHAAGGKPVPMQGVQGSNAIHIFGLTMCSTGLTQEVAEEMGMSVDTVTVEELIRPAFMPENNTVILKIVWDKSTRRLIGAQIISQEDVSLALHVFSLAIQEKYSVDRLALLDTFFLPHFNQPHNFITKAGLLAMKK